MAMTRKDFEAIAGAVKAARDAGDPDPSPILAPAKEVRRYHMIFDSMARELANVCAKQNPRFDRERFLTACGVK